jgi:purine-binding chemotaxis protein CheW
MSARPSLDDYLSSLLDPPARPAMATPAAFPVPEPDAAVAVAVVAAPAAVPAAVAAPARPVIQPVAPVPAVRAEVQAPAPAARAAALPAAAAPHSAAAALLDRLAQQNAEDTPRRRAAERSTRWLRMRCDEQHYAIELLKVQEVILPGVLLPLRGAAPHMLGVMNLRGQIVPVIDLGLYLQRDAIVPDPASRIVVLEEHGETLGLRVSAVDDVASLTDHQIEPPDNSRVCRLTSALFRGVARVGGRPLILLDASSLLG